MTKRLCAVIMLAVLLMQSAAVFAKTVGEYISDGNEAFHERNFDQAIYEYTKALDIDPNVDKAYDNRGAAYAQEGSLTRAVDDFTMAIANNPVDMQAYQNRKMAYFQLKDYDKAWADVFKIEQLGGSVDHDFYQLLKKASGKP